MTPEEKQIHLWMKVKELMLAAKDRNMTPEQWAKMMHSLGYRVSNKSKKV